MKIAILEDDSRRIRRMLRCLRERFPDYEVVVFDGAPEMIAWLEQHLPEVKLICLDHDLSANRLIGGQPVDPGTGRDVADYLASQRPCCPVLIHSTNSLAVPGMMMVLEDAGWRCSAISPFNDLEWVRTAWLENVIEALGQSIDDSLKPVVEEGFVPNMPVNYIKGDATLPQGTGPRVVVHVCNDVGAWGKGFVVAISKKWPGPERSYRDWHKNGADVPFELGEVQFVEVEPSLWVANLIGQHGLRRCGGVPPIRYEAVREGLRRVAEFATAHGATIHMPRIGCGLAGGSWDKVVAILEEELAGLDVTVYDLALSKRLPGIGEQTQERP